MTKINVGVEGIDRELIIHIFSNYYYLEKSSERSHTALNMRHALGCHLLYTNILHTFIIAKLLLFGQVYNFSYRCLFEHQVLTKTTLEINIRFWLKKKLVLSPFDWELLILQNIISSYGINHFDFLSIHSGLMPWQYFLIFSIHIIAQNK